jgi:hypothetical protein
VDVVVDLARDATVKAVVNPELLRIGGWEGLGGVDDPHRVIINVRIAAANQ